MPPSWQYPAFPQDRYLSGSWASSAFDEERYLIGPPKKILGLARKALLLSDVGERKDGRVYAGDNGSGGPTWDLGVVTADMLRRPLGFSYLDIKYWLPVQVRELEKVLRVKIDDSGRHTHIPIMATADVLSPSHTPAPHRRPITDSALANFDSVEGLGDNDDQYATYKKLQRQLEYIRLQEEYIKDEQRSLKRELVRAQEEIKRIQSVPLVIGQFMEAIDNNTGIVQSSTGSNYVVRILSTLDRELLKPNSTVALHRHSNSLVDILPPEADSSIAMLQPDEKPDVTYADVGGLDMQKQEIREAVELPLTQFDLYKQIGIDPPRGVLLYGPPGTGKTMLVKAVANSTTASFIRVVGSEFVQKYLGEGPRMVRDVFRMARENSPAIIFIDEIDAIATKRFDAQTGADREVQRILLELLNQMDGFDQTSNVKVIMATNRADTLDPALLRPGRLDRKIEFPSLRDRRERRLIFSTIASKMSLSPEVDLDSLIVRNDPLSGAVIAAVMQEAGLRAVRKNRYNIIQQDLEDAYTAQVKGASESDKFDFYK
ncbi:26S proteasome regulatory subunit 6B [Teratosphaeriaceae sp. CCFEE 6253]|nr:26S proteasome regulatory subunit 6B [Teratosphaeriaceae sp. CCFEE 6253]